MKRVLLAALSPMLQSIVVDTLSTCGDIALTTADRADTADGRDVDVVLTTAPDPDNLEGFVNLLWRWPKSRVVVVATSGRDAVLYELAPRKLSLGDLCPSTLVDAIRGERPIGGERR